MSFPEFLGVVFLTVAGLLFGFTLFTSWLARTLRSA